MEILTNWSPFAVSAKAEKSFAFIRPRPDSAFGEIPPLVCKPGLKDLLFTNWKYHMLNNITLTIGNSSGADSSATLGDSFYPPCCLNNLPPAASHYTNLQYYHSNTVGAL